MQSTAPPFRYVDGSVSYDTAEVFYARLAPEFYLVDQLMVALYHLLWFPGYFGFNWNALDECFRDFSWLTEEKIVLVHPALPQLPAAALKLYLEVLCDTVLYWRNRPSHDFEVVFPESAREQMNLIVGDYLSVDKYAAGSWPDLA